MRRSIWDDSKNLSNQRKHAVSFEIAARVFDDLLHLSEADRIEDGEQCRQTVGMVGGIALLLVAHTYEGAEKTAPDVIRIISARRATKRERRAYEEG